MPDIISKPRHTDRFHAALINVRGHPILTPPILFLPDVSQIVMVRVAIRRMDSDIAAIHRTVESARWSMDVWPKIMKKYLSLADDGPIHTTS